MLQTCDPYPCTRVTYFKYPIYSNSNQMVSVLSSVVGLSPLQKSKIYQVSGTDGVPPSGQNSWEIEIGFVDSRAI
jgi:hypothetical protein